MVKKHNGYGEGSFTFLQSKKLYHHKYPIILPDGSVDRHSFYGKTKRICIEKREAYKKSLLSLPRDKSSVTVEEIGNKWLHGKKAVSIEDTTYDRYESTFINNVVPKIGHIAIQELSTFDVQELLVNQMIADGYSVSSVRKAYTQVNAICKYALGVFISFNPCDKVEIPKKIAKKQSVNITYLEDDEIPRFKEACREEFGNGTRRYVNGEAYIIMLNTGLRMSEMLGLTWDNVDFDKKEIFIDHIVIASKNRDGSDEKYSVKHIERTKTDRSRRRVPLNQTAITGLLYLKKIARPENKFVVQNTKYNTPIPPSSFEKTYNRIIDYAGIDSSKHGTHTLRHTFATHHFKSRTDVKYISKWLGHKDVNTTYDKYIHIIEKYERDVFSQVDDI